VKVNIKKQRLWLLNAACVRMQGATVVVVVASWGVPSLFSLSLSLFWSLLRVASAAANHGRL
jgi:hypothetical protein